MKNKEYDSTGKIIGTIKLSIITFIIFTLGFIPLVIGGKIVLMYISFTEIWHFFLLPVLIYIGIGLTLWYQLLISGLIIHIFKIKYEPGEYHYTFNNKTTFKWVLFCILYTPMRKLLEIFPMGGMKYRYYRLLGMKIGENTLVGGTIMDPCLTEIGDNCTMGLYSVIYGHIHDYEKTTLLLDRIKIGDNVVIGAGVFIMPGAVIENDVKIATGAVVTKGQVLKKGNVYAGIPAKTIKTKNKN
jgi:hypothetical protein